MATNREPERFTIAIGPQHPALKEPGSFQFTVDGEIVTKAYVRLGYAHRGIEKAAEQRNWIQDLYLLERVCGICSHIHATAYCLAVEQLAHVEAPAARSGHSGAGSRAGTHPQPFPLDWSFCPRGRIRDTLHVFLA